MLALGCCESRGVAVQGRVPSLMAAVVESGAVEYTLFAISLTCRPRGFWLEHGRNEVYINPSLTLDKLVGRQGGGLSIWVYS